MSISFEVDVLFAATKALHKPAEQMCAQIKKYGPWGKHMIHGKSCGQPRIGPEPICFICLQRNLQGEMKEDLMAKEWRHYRREWSLSLCEAPSWENIFCLAL